MQEMLHLAAEAAVQGEEDRIYLLGAVAIRNRDGVRVKAFNGAAIEPCGHAHAEARVLRKAGLESIVFVSRVARRDGKLTLARPCDNCLALMRSYKVKRCFYSIDESRYGLITFRNNKMIESLKFFSKEVTTDFKS